MALLVLSSCSGSTSPTVEPASTPSAVKRANSDGTEPKSAVDEETRAEAAKQLRGEQLAELARIEHQRAGIPAADPLLPMV